MAKRKGTSNSSPGINTPPWFEYKPDEGTNTKAIHLEISGGELGKVVKNFKRI